MRLLAAIHAALAARTAPTPPPPPLVLINRNWLCSACQVLWRADGREPCWCCASVQHVGHPGHDDEGEA